MTRFGDEWEQDKLNRNEDANFLSEYLIGKYGVKDSDTNDGSFVLNVNGEWGFGKTYFLKNWADDLVKKRHPVVYFDAWENDFSKEPLLALISTINEQLSPFLTTPKVQAGLQKWLKTGKKLLAPSAPLLMSILAKKAFEMSSEELSEYLSDEGDTNSSEGSLVESTESNSDGIESAVGTVVSKAASKMLETHSSTKHTIKEFKDNLGEITKHIDSLRSKNAPIFIFIDELDRCRPDYAIEILENIKHLFGVRGVFFVIATASEQLSHSIQAVYGNNFDGVNYLKRFFDQAYTLNEPNRYSYSAYLFSKYKLDDRENIYSPLSETKTISGGGSLTEAFAWVSSLFGVGLRDMEQYCIVIDSISLTFKEEKIHILYLVFLMALKHKHNDVYEKYKNGNDIDLRELSLNPEEYRRKIETHNYTSQIEIVFSDIINQYIRFSKKSYYALDELGRASSGLSEDIRKTLIENWSYGQVNNRASTHYLLNYPSLIEQAGNLTILSIDDEG